MRKVICLMSVGSLVFSEIAPGWADDTLQFFQEEAKVVTASHEPQAANQAPATVYVVTAEDIKDSGAQTIPDALRNVPGVQVIETQTGQSEVGIRGLDKPINTAVLVLLDGKAVQSGYFSNVVWESIPIELDQIDRLEVVEGPASAVYGADAVSGVINIISKTPEQLQGGQVSYTTGERHTETGSLIYGHKQDDLAYRFGGGWHSTNHYDNANSQATKAGKFNGLVNYDFSDHSGLSLSGGVDSYATDYVLDGFGLLQDRGLTNFIRTDYHFRDTSFNAYWNRESKDPEGNNVYDSLITNRYDLTLEQAVTPFDSNHAVFGGNYRKNTAEATVLGGNLIQQDLWAFYFEDKWQLASKWLLMTSARVDRHPLTPIRFSPRGSLLYTPFVDHVFRVSAGTAFRNPTLLENYVDGIETQPNRGGTNLPPAPPFSPFAYLSNTILGSRTLSPETIEEQEVAYEGRWNRLKTTLTGFHYTFNHAIMPSLIPVTQMPPTYNLSTLEFSNVDNSTLTAWGSELAADYYVTSWLRLMGNYSYEYLHETIFPELAAENTPRHEANVGLRTKTGGLTTQWMLNWVNSTYWPLAGQVTDNNATVKAYFLLNARVGYAFSGRWSGLEMAMNAFNLLNHDHYEVSPTSQEVEIVKSTLTGTVSYKF